MAKKSILSAGNNQQETAQKQTVSDGIVEFIKTLVYAGLIAGAVRTVAFEPFNIPSGSMIPTLLVGDYLFVAKYSYGFSHYSLPFGPNLFSGRLFFRAPKRGDVVVFKLPRDDSQDYIKRLVGLPGDRIQVIHRELWINGKKLERERIDDYRYEHFPTENSSSLCPQYVETFDNGVKHQIIEFAVPESAADDTIEYVVPEKSYFMMGDDRDNSADSRFPPEARGVGFVPEENLVGRAEVIFFSHSFFQPSWSPWWQFWEWQYSIRWDRIFTLIR